MENIRVREVIRIEGWQHGQGFTYSQAYSDDIITATQKDLASDMDWDFWETPDDWDCLLYTSPSPRDS